MVSKRLVLVAAATSAMAQIYVPPGLGYFTLHTIAPTNATFVVVDPINADGGKFWVGKPTAQTCTTLPEVCEHLAPSTVFWVDSNSLEGDTTPPSSLALSTLSGREGKVQSVYVANDGSLSYTAPGESIPANAQTSNAFSYTTEASRTDYGTLDISERGWAACGAPKSWQIFNLAGTDLAQACYPISVLTRPYWSGVSVDSYRDGA